MPCAGCGGGGGVVVNMGSSAPINYQVTNGQATPSATIPGDINMKSVILVYVGPNAGSINYHVESFTYVLGGNDMTRSAYVLEDHARILMDQNPLTFVTVPDESKENVNMMGATIASITGIKNLGETEKQKLVEGGFVTAGQLLSVTPSILSSHIGKDDAYATILQNGLKDRFGIPHAGATTLPTTPVTEDSSATPAPTTTAPTPTTTTTAPTPTTT